MRAAAMLLAAWVALGANSTASPQADADANRTLEQAILLSGVPRLILHVELVARLDAAASADAEAWTTRDEEGRAERILVYTNSQVFRCANRPHSRWQCVLKLASIIVHEATHLRGLREADAYAEQLAFLRLRDASGEMLSGVEKARKHALARERLSIDRARSVALRAEHR